MKDHFIPAILITIFTVAAFAQDPTDLEKRDLKGTVKTVKFHEMHFRGPGDDRQQGERNMSGTSDFDRAGNIIEMVEFTRDGDGTYYERYVHSYDSDNRKSSVIKYISGKSEPNRFFDLQSSTNAYRHLMQTSGESLATKTFYRYDKKGLLIEKIEVRANGEISERHVFAYDENGKNTRFAIYKENTEPVLEILMKHASDGRTSESVRFENGKEVNKVFYVYDEKGRIVTEEQYMMRSIPSLYSNKHVLSSRSTKTYSEDKTNMEWFISDENGNPRTKLVILDQNDEEIARDSYEYRMPKSSDSNPKFEWRLTEREFRKYEYDKQGNWVKCVWYRQDDLEKPAHPTLIEEREISYY